MSNPIHVLLFAALLVGYVLPAALVARLAARRGRSFTIYLVASLLIWWVLPLAVLLIRHHDAGRRDVPT
jgi:MFS family permease